MTTVLRRTLIYWRENGLAATVRRVGEAAYRNCFANGFVVFGCDVCSQKRSPASPNSVRIHRACSEQDLTGNEQSVLADFWDRYQGYCRVVSRFKRGAHLWTIECDGTLAGYGWSIKGKTIRPHFVPLSENDVHLFDFHVFSEYRGRGLNPLLVTSILDAARRDDITRAYIEVAQWNTAQLRSLRKTDFKPLGLARKFSLGTQAIVWWKGHRLVLGTCEAADSGVVQKLSAV